MEVKICHNNFAIFLNRPNLLKVQLCITNCLQLCLLWVKIEKCLLRQSKTGFFWLNVRVNAVLITCRLSLDFFLNRQGLVNDPNLQEVVNGILTIMSSPTNELIFSCSKYIFFKSNRYQSVLFYLHRNFVKTPP